MMQHRETEHDVQTPFQLLDPDPGRSLLQKPPRETKGHPRFLDLMHLLRRVPLPPNQRSFLRCSTWVQDAYSQVSSKLFLGFVFILAMVYAAQKHFSDLRNLERQGQAILGIHLRMQL